MATSPHLDLNALLSFAAVAEAGGFTAAAERLGVAKAKVSLDVARLESRLGTALFVRTTRRVAPTDAGRALYAECIPPLRGVIDALSLTREADRGLAGSLRIACTVDHAATVAQAVAAFAALHPALQIDLRSSDRVTDMVKEGVDLALRAGWLRDSSLRAVKLDSFEQQLVAAPLYLRRAGVPRHPRELVQHPWLALTLLQSPLTWTFSGAAGSKARVRVVARMRTDSTAALRALLEAGAGISVLDQFGAQAALREGRLVRLLPDWELARGGIYAVFPPGRHVAANAKAFVEYYRDHLARGTGGAEVRPALATKVRSTSRA
jgi:DNA-binding transcriptional LysR family regulator